MTLQKRMPLFRRAALGTRAAMVSAVIRGSAHLPDEWLVRGVRRLAGTNQFPMGQAFLEKALVSLKRAIARANPRCRTKLIQNLIVNEMVRGQEQRNWVTEQLGYEIPLLLVISPTMRCPLRCYGCYSAEYARNSDLEFATLDGLLSEAESLGNYFMVISGGEPFIYDGIYDLWKKHDQIWFQVYTSGVTLNQGNVAKLAELGNVMPCLSVEGFEEQTDKRRGKGHFQRLLEVFARLREAGVPFGVSATATRENNDLIMSDEFVKFYADQGALVGWYFQYMPVGREPVMELMPTPEQRLYRYQRLQELRASHDILLADFWNDGPLVGGCIAGGRRYLHINNAGDVEPCVFCQLSTDNIHEKSLLEVLRSSRLLAAIRKRQPYSDNYLRPCMMLDNPDVLEAVVEEAKPRETCKGGALRLVRDLKPTLRAYAERWQSLAEPVWREKYEVLYRKPIAEAHALAQSHEREHGALAAGKPASGVVAPAPAASVPSPTRATPVLTRPPSRGGSLEFSDAAPPPEVDGAAPSPPASFASRQ
ncbi:MAG: radical SAM protein [Polyangia bacterium]